MAMCEFLKLLRSALSLWLWPQGISASNESRCSRVPLRYCIFCSDWIGSSCIIFEVRRDSHLHANGEVRALAPERGSRRRALFAFKQFCQGVWSSSLSDLLTSRSFRGQDRAILQNKSRVFTAKQTLPGGKWSLIRHPTKANCLLSSPGFPVALTESVPSLCFWGTVTALSTGAFHKGESILRPPFCRREN